MRVRIAPDLESWILSWGEHAQVLAPTSLKNSIAARLREAASRYFPDPKSA
jgi:predicted DNA-binding transcriptional regulator YafY